ncbi:unnamed protein product [Trichobilharzia regenti]|nr:unnamed protein product [Trichobilharzia regenti]
MRILVDSTASHHSPIKFELNQLNLKLGPIINTHLHADHVTGSGLLKRIPGSYSVLGHYDGAKSDMKIRPGDRIKFGNFELECRSTPGRCFHTFHYYNYYYFY